MQVVNSANCLGHICCPYYRDLKGLRGQWLCVGFNCVCMYLCVWERRVTVGMCFACVEWVVCIWVGLFVCVRCKMEESRLSHWCCIGNGCWIREREGGKPTHCQQQTWRETSRVCKRGEGDVMLWGEGVWMEWPNEAWRWRTVWWLFQWTTVMMKIDRPLSPSCVHLNSSKV